MPHSMASCHPDREMHARGLCDYCYSVRDAASKQRRREIALKSYYKAKAEGRSRRPTKEQRAAITESQRKWRAKNPEKVAAYVAKRRLGYRDEHLTRNYGMTVVEYDKMLEAQGGVCATCGKPPTAYRGGQNLVVDHDHETGKVRGLIHHSCNHVMSVFDNEILFRRFMRYKRGGTVAQRRSRIGRVCEYFRTADLDEVRVVWALVQDIYNKRIAAEGGAVAKAKRTRKVKTVAQKATTLKPGDVIETETLANA